MFQRLTCFRDASHHHHHHGVVTPWKDLYFPKGCGGPGPGTGAASGSGGVIGGQPGTAGTPRPFLKCQSLLVFKCPHLNVINLLIISFPRNKCCCFKFFRLLARVPGMI